MKTTFIRYFRSAFGLIVFLTFFSLVSLSQNEKMVVEGAIVIDNNEDPNPVPGTIRWTGTDFEGYDGTAWLSLTCCNAVTPDSTVVTDQEGNDIPIAFIGTQCWMTENLRVTTYNDGTPIPFAADGAAWSAGSSQGPLCSWPLDNPSLAIPHGAIYNYNATDPAMNGGKNICPVGWHIPTSADIATLMLFLDPGGFATQSSIAGGMMKETGTVNWASPNTGATNSSGFSAVPSIRRSGNSWIPSTTDEMLIFWIDGNNFSTVAQAIDIFHDSALAATANYSMSFGNSCRCVKD